MPNHIFRDPHIIVGLAIVDLKDQTDEVGQDCSTPRLRLDWWYSLARLGSDYWETAIILSYASREGIYDLVEIPKNLRDNVRPCVKILALYIVIGDQQDIPFQTERVNKAPVTFISSQ